MKFSDLAINTQAAEQGVWQDLGAFQVCLSFAGLSNKVFQKKLEELTKPHRKAIDLGMFPAERALEIVQRAYAEVIVRDWKGFTEEDGTTAKPYSVEACMELFRINPKSFTAIKEIAEDDAVFRSKSLEAAGGNSQKPSSTP